MTPQNDINSLYVWMISVTAACGGLLFGYDWVVIGGAKPFYEVYFGIDSEAMAGWAVSSALVGCIIGAPLSAIMSEKYGRKKTLLLAAFLFVISAMGTAMAGSFSAFVMFRIVGGLGIGLAATISPMYIAEISPPDRRGKMVVVNQLMIVIGILAAQLINLMIAEPAALVQGSQEELMSWNVQSGWRYMFAAELVPAIAFFGMMFLVPESPRWLCKVAAQEKARAVLEKIGSRRYADETLQDIQTSLARIKTPFRFSDIKSKRILGLLMLGATLATYQQWSGINIIFNYAQEVFASAGFNIDDTLRSIVATGVVNLIFTLVALPLVDSFGRRKLMLVGSAGLAIVHGMIAFAYANGQLGLPVLILVLCAIAIYATTLAPVTWVLLAEIFPNRIRGFAMGFATFVLWVSSFALTFSYPMINFSLGASGSFILFSGISCLGFYFVFHHVPETKGQTLEALEADICWEDAK